ncbi:MAG: glycosyltransferase family 2 protein [Sulfuritalea sp.]|nr:glycosyltransferase family 2 protein [Sulfuritalea sp.]
MNNLWVVIPAMNEGSCIHDVVRGVRDLYKQVVVVDDGSTDDTVTRALEAGAIVVRHPVNLGQGASIQTGIEYALEQGADLIATFDADGQHQPDDLARLVSALEPARADVALGSRFLGDAPGISLGRRALLRLAIWYTILSTGLRLTDAHNGLRVFTRAAATRIRITQNRMAHASEILEAIATLKLRFVEVPVTIKYTEYSKQKGQRGSDALKILTDLFVGRFHN